MPLAAVTAGATLGMLQGTHAGARGESILCVPGVPGFQMSGEVPASLTMQPLDRSSSYPTWQDVRCRPLIAAPQHCRATGNIATSIVGVL